MPLGAHLREFLWLPFVDASLHFGDGALRGSDRKLLAAELHRAVTARFEPLVERAEVARLMRLKEEDPQALPRVLRTPMDRFK